MLFVGVMTGTSVDGLDLALIEAPEDFKPKAATTIPLPASLRDRLLALATPGDDEITRLGNAHIELGAFTGTAILDFLNQIDVTPNLVRAIGSHGQTIRHYPNQKHPFTLQIGDGNTIAERTGIDVVADFRGRDVAAGGQGAPLVPNYHRRLFGDSANRVILNIGGIANVSILGSKEDVVRGFDTGPGNALLDAWIQHSQGKTYDERGEWAQSGHVNHDLLTQLLEDAYYIQDPPKSTGKEHFNIEYLKRHLKMTSAIKDADVQRTLVELTACTVSEAIDRHAPACQEIVVCGGGRLNDFLISKLENLSRPKAVRRSEELDIDGDAIEAGAFAYLAWQFIEGLPGNEPSVTGAEGFRVLGCLYPGR